jgi:hypothetical protein
MHYIKSRLININHITEVNSHRMVSSGLHFHQTVGRLQIPGGIANTNLEGI